MEQWIKWNPHPDIKRTLWLTKTVIKKNKFLIYGEIADKDNDDTIKYIKFEYKDSVLSYRKTDEGNRLKTFGYLDNHYNKEFYTSCDLFIIKNSNYTKWFLEECLDAPPNVPIEHHVLLTEEVVDILCSKKPEITVSNTELI